MENANPYEQRALAREADLVVQKLPNEVMVYDLRTHKAHCLNETAAFVWRHCDGRTNVRDLASLLGQKSGSPVDEEVIWYALDKLNKVDLLETRVDVPVKDGMSRRRMIRRMGALVVLPAVVSLVAPTALAQVTVVTTSKKVADGTCNTPPGPPPNPNCTSDTCCTGSSRLCLSTGPTSSGCVGGPCQPAAAANFCNS